MRINVTYGYYYYPEKKINLRAGTGKSRITESLDLEGASVILIQTSPFTDEKIRPRELAQGHQLVRSGSSAPGVQIWISGALIKFSPLLMWCLRAHTFVSGNRV